MKPWAVYVGIAACMGLLLWRTQYLGSELELEKAAHKATMRERDDWEAQALAARASAEALAENARACLAREVRAQADAAERAAIMAQVKPRPRTEAEQTKVVDDETRKRVADRLNRPL